MDLVNASPKELVSISQLILKDDSALAEFLGSIEAALKGHPLDGGAFRDELFMFGVRLSKYGVLSAAGPGRVSHVLAGLSNDIISVFLEGVENSLAEQIRRELAIAAKVGQSVKVHSDALTLAILAQAPKTFVGEATLLARKEAELRAQYINKRTRFWRLNRKNKSGKRRYSKKFAEKVAEAIVANGLFLEVQYPTQEEGTPDKSDLKGLTG
ncbi:hypothetical protein [Neorhizobium vignae]|uniref:hypothetical protein n=1 Tax=Neorhizobium vignae TaxID=690585 RepID=UPI00056D4682|nr:hypothetical protein [Neorhizobium vignae]